MEETYKMMISFLEGKIFTKTENELIQDYQQKQESDILAWFFVSNYGLMRRFAQKYTNIDNQDIASYCLQELDNALLKFNFSKDCSFITFFYSCLNNKLKLEVNKIKKDAICYIEELPEYEEIADNNFSFDNVNNFNLSREELELCNYITYGYSYREIASFLHITHTAVYKRIKKLQKIFSV